MRALAELEPRQAFPARVVYRDPAAASVPGGLVRAYAALFARRAVSRLFSGDARSLEQDPQGWTVRTDAGPVSARRSGGGDGAVVRRNVRRWATTFPSRRQARLPHALSRAGQCDARPSLLDADGGYLLAPMARGVRLTTGAEFSTRDAAAFARAARPCRGRWRGKWRFRSPNASMRRRGWDRGPACLTCCR